MACIAQSVNVLSPLMTTKEGVIRQTTWWPYELFCKYMRGHTIGCHLFCDAYDGTTKPDSIRGTKDTPWLDVSATVDDSGWVSLCVVNIHETQDIPTNLEQCHGAVQVFTVTGTNLKVNNMEGREEVGVKESTWDARGTYTFPKHSMTLLRWQS
jgi:alpha-N-arabinofuranosidase